MRTKKTKVIAINAALAALYIALTLCSPLSFGIINFRLADAVQVIACVDKRTRKGISAGMITANLFSPFGVCDALAAVVICAVTFGAGWSIRSEKARVWLLILATSLIVGVEISVLEGVSFWLITGGMFLSETFLCWGGYFVIKKMQLLRVI